jgi:spore protease
LHKKPGLYYTVDISNQDFHDNDVYERIENVLKQVIEEVIGFEAMAGGKCLIVGLGNVNVTPDSLGPYVLDNVIVTRHLFKLGTMSDGFSEVSAFAPGVMGNTGIETFDIIKSVKDEIDIDYIIAVDALAASSIARVNKTIQVTNTGISPGSGVGNKRKELSRESIGIPVIAIGVPTVVDAATITNETIDYILKFLANEMAGNNQAANALTPGSRLRMDFEKIEEPGKDIKQQFFGQVGLLSDNDKRSLIAEVLTPNGYNMMVTPKEIDADIEDLAKIISGAIDTALHKSVTHS